MKGSTTINYRKTTTGKYVGRIGQVYITIYRRPHGKWCALYGSAGEWLDREGYHGTYLKTLAQAKRWIKSKLNPAPAA